jgi:hypothetical protein
VLTGIEFGPKMVCDMLTYDNFKYFGKNENRDRSVTIHHGNLSFFENGNNDVLLPVGREN